LHTITSTVEPIKKGCASDGSITRVGGCVFKAGCNSNPKTERFLGYMTWDSPVVDGTTSNIKTRLAAVTPDTLGLKSLAFSMSATACNGVSSPVALSLRLCNAYFDSKNTLVGKAWNDVDLSQPGVLNCIAKNPT
jgi:hypothetical protein